MGILLLVVLCVLCQVVNSVVNFDANHRTNTTLGSLIVLGGAEIERSESRRLHYPGGERHYPAGTPSDCDALVRGQEGWIFTPNYPSDYDDHRTCDYVIQRLTPDTCKVEMTLNDFDLEESDHCLNDYLDLRDGQQGVLCGALASGTKKQLQFRSGQYTMTLRFKTDKENTRKGFMIQLKQIPRSCGAANIPTGPSACNQYMDTFTGSVSSPGYPNGYPSNIRCAYTIRRADSRICKVLLEIRLLDFGRHTGGPCRGDYIEFPDLSRTCAGYPSRKIVDFLRGSDLLTFTFVSDGYGSGKGFDIEILQVPDSCATSSPPSRLPRPGDSQPCDQEVSSVTGHFTSPRFPNPYGPNERCRYTLRKVDPSVCSVELDFRRFELEYSGPRCSKDYLTLPSLNRLCGSISGKQLMELPKDSDYVNLYFVSDFSGHGLGFDIHVTQLFNTCEGTRLHGPCDQEVGTLTGRFTSPGFPTSYPANQRCTYSVHRADATVCSVELRFVSFDIEYSGEQCSKDFLMMPDRTRLCGTTSGTRTIKFPAGSDILALNFFSDGFRTGRGFDIEVTQRRNTCRVPASDCGGEVTSSAGRISSPGYPRYYTSGLRCHYKIRRPDPSTCTVELDFRVFDVATSAGCSEDYLQLPDQTRLCGSQTTSKALDYSAVGSDVMTLTFVTDSIGAGRGFDIVVRQLPNSCSILPPPPSCDMTISEERTVIHSPNYPEDYPADALCVYSVRRLDRSVCQVQVEFLDFDLEPAPDCGSDFVQLEKNGERFCGVQTPPTTVLSFGDGDILRMVFRSDSVSSRRGFEARVRQIRNSCYRPIGPANGRQCGTYSDTMFTIQSENFPLLYPPNSDCEYRIVRQNPTICQVELFFSHFDVASENPAHCDRDFLEVKGARYCGKRDGQRVLVDFPKERNELTLHFKSDSYQQLSGFRIEVKQLTSGCPPLENKTCEQTFSSESFQVISPGYQSGSYPDGSDCRYTVKKSSFQVCALQVKFYTFDLEQSEDCAKDYLDIAEQKLCGRMEYDSVRTYEFLEDEMIIQFHSDGFKNGAGFFLLFEQKTC
ncbi:cubilin-like isoform X2 [Argiope bruennichi]|uniref:cubilin-like isoform X2 n=1 Tax=Argiope bruennichi TaxID=94029 RepID=UPI0024948DF8|nr:cubilin-like isoform X2 [Argiope bruennichi]